MRCLNCGTNNSEININCSNCGAKLESDKKIRNLLKNKKAILIIIAVVIVVIIGIIAVFNFTIAPNLAAKKMQKAFESKSGAEVIYVFNKYCGDYSVVYDELSKSGKKVFVEFEDYVIESKENLNNQTVGTDINNYILGSTGDIILPEKYSAITTIAQYNNELNTIVSDYYELYMSKINYIKGVELLDNQDIKFAESVFSKVIESDSWYDEAQNKMTQIQNIQFKEKAEIIEKYINNKNFKSALREIDKLRNENPTDEINKKLDEYETKICELVIEKVEEYLENGRLEAAKEYIKSINDSISSKSKSGFDEALKKKATDYIAKAEEAFKSGERQGAYDMAIIAQALNSDDDEINKKVSYFEEYLPYNLYIEKNAVSYKGTAVHSLSGGIWFDYEATSNTSKKYSHCIHFEGKNNEYMKITYNLEGKYNTLSGTYFLGEFNKNWNRKSDYFVIYGDGKKLFTSDNITSGTKPKDINVDVTNINTLVVQFNSGTGPEGTAGWYNIANFVATKNLPE